MLVGFLSSSHSWNVDQSLEGLHGSFPRKKSGQTALYSGEKTEKKKTGKRIQLIVSWTRYHLWLNYTKFISAPILALLFKRSVFILQHTWLQFEYYWHKGGEKYILHVSVRSEHVSHVLCIGQLPSKNVLNYNDRFVSWCVRFHHVSFNVLNLNLLAKTAIFHLVPNVTRAWPGFICHLEIEIRFDIVWNLLHCCIDKVNTFHFHTVIRDSETMLGHT